MRHTRPMCLSKLEILSNVCMYDSMRAFVTRRSYSLSSHECCTAVGLPKNHIWKSSSREWHWRWLKVIGIASVRKAIYHFLLVVRSSNDSIGPIALFVVSEILPNSVHDWLWPWEVLRFRKDSWNYKPRAWAFRFMCKHIVDNTRFISRGMRDRKVSNSKSDLQGH